LQLASSTNHGSEVMAVSGDFYCEDIGDFVSVNDDEDSDEPQQSEGLAESNNTGHSTDESGRTT